MDSKCVEVAHVLSLVESEVICSASCSQEYNITSEIFKSVNVCVLAKDFKCVSVVMRFAI